MRYILAIVVACAVGAPTAYALPSAGSLVLSKPAGVTQLAAFNKRTGKRGPQKSTNNANMPNR